MEIKPSSYNMTVEFVDSDDDTLDSDVMLAVVTGVGDEVKVKKGSTVVLHKHAKDDGIKVDETTYVVPSYCLVGTVVAD